MGEAKNSFICLIKVSHSTFAMGESDDVKEAVAVLEAALPELPSVAVIADEAPAAPVVETPCCEAPVVEAPTVEVPVVETPIIEAPVAAGPNDFGIGLTVEG